MPEVIHLHRTTVREDGAPEAAHAAADMRPIYGAGPNIGEDDDDLPGEGAGVILWPLLIIAMVAFGYALGVVFA